MLSRLGTRSLVQRHSNVGSCCEYVPAWHISYEKSLFSIFKKTSGKIKKLFVIFRTKGDVYTHFGIEFDRNLCLRS